MNIPDSEKGIRDELIKRGYIQVHESRYCGISFVGGISVIFVHPSGVVGCFQFETGEFEAGENFGKKPERKVAEDAMYKEIRRAWLYACVDPEKNDLMSIKYLESKFDVTSLWQTRPDREMLEFTYDYYDNQERNRDRNNTVSDLFHVIGDILTFGLKLFPAEYKGFQLLNAMEGNSLCCDNEKADAALEERLALIQLTYPSMFSPPLSTKQSRTMPPTESPAYEPTDEERKYLNASKSPAYEPTDEERKYLNASKSPAYEPVAEKPSVKKRIAKKRA